MIVDISARTPATNATILDTIKAAVSGRGWGEITHMIPIDGVPRPGRPAQRYVDEDGSPVEVPARGQVGMVYFRVRVTTRTMSEIRAAFDFAALGVEVNTPEVIAECDQVLGVWA